VITLRIPELGIKNSRLAEEVIGILQSTDNKFDIARRMVDIADGKIRNQVARDTIDMAIEMARTPNFSLGRKDVRKIKRLLVAAKDDCAKIRRLSSSFGDCLDGVEYWLEKLIASLPRSPEEMVYEKLKNGTITEENFSFYFMRLRLQEILGDIDACDAGGFEKVRNRLRSRIKAVAKIVGASESLLKSHDVGR